MPHRHSMSPDEREAWLAELRARHEAGTLTEVLLPDCDGMARLLSDVKRERPRKSGRASR